VTYGRRRFWPSGFISTLPPGKLAFPRRLAIDPTESPATLQKFLMIGL